MPRGAQIALAFLLCGPQIPALVLFAGLSPGHRVDHIASPAPPAVTSGQGSVSRATMAPLREEAGDATAVVFSEEERGRILRYSSLGSPPADPSNSVADSDGAARLGQRLFFETRLSRGSVSCATCHVPSHGFADGKPLSEGLARGRRRTPSLWNVAYNRWYFWDGRKDSLWSQALSPIESDTEMGGTRTGAVHLLVSDPLLRAAYEAVFGPLPDLADASRFPAVGRPVPERPEDPRHVAWLAMRAEDRNAVDRVFSRVGKAIEAYERRLLSRSSPFDRFLGEMRTDRDGGALSPSARRGLKLFVGRGNCRLCHSGPNLTDGEFHNIGVPPGDRTLPADAGRHGGIDALLRDPFNSLGPFSDAPGDTAAEKLRALRRTPDTWGQFKTPSLRNVARRTPYMHQGQFATLRDVLRFYSTREGALPPGPDQEKVLIPLRLSDQETDDLVAFLESLTDEGIDPSLLEAPAPSPPPPAPASAPAGH